MNILIFSEYRSLLDTRPTFKCIEIAIVGKICIQHSPFLLLAVLYFSSVPLSLKESAIEVEKGASASFFFHAEMNNPVFCTVPAESSEEL